MLPTILNLKDIKSCSLTLTDPEFNRKHRLIYKEQFEEIIEA
jgi:hypothetical protein